jgi:uncharacterized paraquat-inducible protein A
MPRYRTIACDHCGFLQLKRDKFCDRCGRLTARERRSQLVYWFGLAIVAVVIGITFWHLSSTIPEMVR